MMMEVGEDEHGTSAGPDARTTTTTTGVMTRAAARRRQQQQADKKKKKTMDTAGCTDDHIMDGKDEETASGCGTIWLQARDCMDDEVSDGEREEVVAHQRPQLPLSARRRGTKRRSSDESDLRPPQCSGTDTVDGDRALKTRASDHDGACQEEEEQQQQGQRRRNPMRVARQTSLLRGMVADVAEQEHAMVLVSEVPKKKCKKEKDEEIGEQQTLNDDDGGGEEDSGTTTDRKRTDIVQRLMNKGQFVAVAADSESDPFWLARLMEPIMGRGVHTTHTTATPTAPGSSVESGRNSNNNKKRKKNDKRGRSRPESEEASTMVRVIWLEPRPDRCDIKKKKKKKNKREKNTGAVAEASHIDEIGEACGDGSSSSSSSSSSGSRGNNDSPRSSLSSFEEFGDGSEGLIPVESIICQVFPEALRGGGWRLNRRDKLRIFRVRVDRPGPPVEWLPSHLLPDRIIWSSHPNLIKPDITFNFSAEEHLLQRDEEEDQEEKMIYQQQARSHVSDPKGSPLLQSSKEGDVCETTSAAAAAVLVRNDSASSASTSPIASSHVNAKADKNILENRKLFKRAARLLCDAQAILIMAGAGMGKDSGLPDYRGAQGFWRSYPPLAKLGITFSESMDPMWFKNDPHQAWGFYGHRAQLYSTTTPHTGFDILRQLSDSKGRDNFFVVTSNIDEQFQKAGFAESSIYECHGSLGHLQCVKPCSHDIWKLGFDEIPTVDMDTLRVQSDKADALPKCRTCGDLARPNVSMAGDTQDTWVEDRSHEQKKRLVQWLKRVMRGQTDMSSYAATPVATGGLDGDCYHQDRDSNGPNNNNNHHESDEMFDDWREIRIKRKRRSTGIMANADEQQLSTQQNPNSNGNHDQTTPTKRVRNRPKLVIVELGCGDSLHSLRIEAELMIRENPSARLIRINPNFAGTMKRGHIALRMGALEALVGIGSQMPQSMRLTPPQAKPGDISADTAPDPTSTTDLCC